jgi:hypothetical protein
MLENQIRANAFETGAFFAANGAPIIKKAGMPNRVGFSAAELCGVSDSLFTHNHPTDMPFSMADIQIAVEQRLVELRAIGPSIRYIMHPTPVWPSFQSINTAAQKEASHVYSDVHGRVRSGQLSSRYASLEIQHLILMRVAQKLGFIYIQEAS